MSPVGKHPYSPLGPAISRVQTSSIGRSAGSPWESNIVDRTDRIAKRNLRKRKSGRRSN